MKGLLTANGILVSLCIMNIFMETSEICTHLVLTSKAEMSVDNLAHKMQSYTYNCSYYGNRKGSELNMYIFGYHRNQVTKADFEIPYYICHMSFYITC